MLSLLSYWVIALGVILGGLILLVIFGLLAMAQQGDKYLEQMEFILSPQQAGPPSRLKEGKPHISCIPAYPHLRLIDVPRPEPSPDPEPQDPDCAVGRL